MALSTVNLETLVSQLGLTNDTPIFLDGPIEALAFSDSPLAGVLGSNTNPILVMSTGLASQVADENTSGSQGTDLGVGGVGGDDATLKFTISTPRGADNFLFDFTFLSEEFPEFVGSTFNDFFSVLIDGQEVALDTNGDPITVNNNFFDGDLSTDGTLFDGRTPLLRVTAPLEPGGQTLNVQLRIAVVGDRIFDSAALISNFGFSSRQIVFVDFDAAFLEFESLLSDAAGLFLLGAGFSSAQEATVIAAVEEIYADFQVDFVTERPVEGAFSTVHVGGSITDLPGVLSMADGLLGLAEKIDTGNSDRSDNAFVLSGEIGNDADDLLQIAQAVAHEAGHLFGLHHVSDPAQLMFPIAGADQTLIGGATPLAEFDENGFLIESTIFQNSFAELAKDLGLADADLIESVSLEDQITKFFTLELSADAATLRDARIIVADSDGKIIELQELGVVRPGEIVNLFAPAIGSDVVALIGKSTADGDFDLALTPDDLGTFSFTGLSQSDVIAQLGITVDSLDGSSFSISATGTDGSLTATGGIVGNATDRSAIDATDGADQFVAAEDGSEIIALSGDGSITGGIAADDLFGNDGDDTITGGDGNDFVGGGAGDDELEGGLGDDFLNGGDGDDLLRGDGGADIVKGGNGDDTIRASLGDLVDGGDGDDEALFRFSFEDSTLSQGEDGAVFTVGGASVEVIDVERLSFVDLTLTGDDIVNLLSPNVATSGGDFLRGDAGADVFLGMAGDDTINGMAGNDNLRGGGGRDKLNGAQGDDTLTGGGGADTLLGGFGVDELRGGGGRDKINGGAGQDFVAGNGGADELRGGGGRDDLEGGGGADKLNGGRGADELTGGGGADVFQFRSGDGFDRITDFQQGRDKIEIVRGAEDFGDLSIS